MAPLWHQHPPQHCIQHPLQHLTTPTMTTTSHHKPPTTHFDPGYAFTPQPCVSTPHLHVSTPRHRFWLPTTPQQCISILTGTPDTCSDHQRPPSPHFNPNWHPRPQNACMIARTCVSPFVFFLFGFRNVCTSNHTHISCVFIYLLFIFTLETCVQLLVHAFLMFLLIYYIFLPSKCMYEQSHTCFLVNTCMQVVVFNKIL